MRTECRYFEHTVIFSKSFLIRNETGFSFHSVLFVSFLIQLQFISMSTCAFGAFGRTGTKDSINSQVKKKFQQQKLHTKRMVELIFTDRILL